MSMINTVKNYADRFADAFNAARLTAGWNNVSTEHLAEVRRLMLDAPEQTRTRQKTSDRPSVAMTIQRAY